MAPRKSQYSLNRKAGKALKFDPTLQEWTEACYMFPLDKQIVKYFSISNETFYCFIDKHRYEEEQTGQPSAFLEAFKHGRMQTKKKINDAFMRKIEDHDTGSILFGMKVYNGAMEQRDIEHVEIKRQQLALKQNEFLTKMAEQFGLNKDELKDFADKFFKETNMENI